MNIKTYHLKCNIKSLVAESRLLRHETKKVTDSELRDSLHNHRVGKVRGALRVANLAYACVKGIPYNKLESKTRLPKDSVEKLINDVKSKACKFSSYDQRDSIDRWLDDARSHLLAV